MKKFLYWSLTGLLSIFMVGSAVTAALASNESTTLSSSTRTLQTAVSSKTITQDQLKKAAGIAIIPGYWKAALVGGWQHGVGVMLEKEPDGSWSNPVFISVSGGSVGPQVGFKSGDMIMVFNTKKAVDQVLNGRFNLGVSSSASAGPGATAQTGTVPADVDTYIDTHGGFIGVSAKGAEISVEQDANSKAYGKKESAQTILAGQVNAPAAAKDLQKTADKLTAVG